MVDRAAEGREGTPFEMTVELGKVREMARAMHADDVPAFIDGSAVPPTFLTCTFHWEEAIPDANPWPHVKMSRSRGMHAEQEYVFHGPPPKVGTRLACRSRIADIFEKQGRRGGTLTFVVMITEFRDETGTLVAEAKMTAVETARPPKDEGTSESEEARP